MPISRWLCSAAVSALISGSAYLGLLAWDTRYYYGSDGHLHGPYEPWQVIGLALVLAVLALVGGIVGRAVPVVVAAGIVITVGVSISGAMSSQNDGLWPVGSFLALVGTTGGMALVAWIAWLCVDGIGASGDEPTGCLPG